MQEIKSEALVKTLGKLKAGGYDYLKKITAVDYPDRVQVVYILYNIEKKNEEIVSVNLPAESPEIETAIGIFRAADWYERELSEMFGIKIKGRKAKRLLLEKWNGSEAPLRKSFKWGDPNYKRIE